MKMGIIIESTDEGVETQSVVLREWYRCLWLIPLLEYKGEYNNTTNEKGLNIML